MRLTASRVVPEDPGRDQARGGQGEAARGLPRRGPGSGRRRRARSAERRSSRRGFRCGRRAKYVFFLGVSTRPARKRGSRRNESRSCGRQIARDVERAVAQAIRDRGGGQRCPELDPVDARPAPSRSRGLRSRTTRSGVWRATWKGPVPSGGPLRRRSRDDGGARIGQEGREDRERVRETNDDLPFGRRRDSLDALASSRGMLGDAADGGEGRRHLVPRQADRALERGLDGPAVRGAPSEKTTPGRRCSRTASPSSSRVQFSQRRRREVALGVRRHQRLEDVGEHLLLLVGLVTARLGRRDRVGDGDDERSAPRDLFLGRLLAGVEPLDLGLVRRGLRVLAAQVGECRGERQEPASDARRRRATRAASMPALGPRRASSMRRACQAVSATRRTAATARAGCFSASKTRTAASPPAAPRRCCPAMRWPWARSSRASPSRVRSSASLGVLEVVERGLRDPDRVLRR